MCRMQFVIKDGQLTAVDWAFNVYGGTQKEDGSWVSKWGSLYATDLKDAGCCLPSPRLQRPTPTSPTSTHDSCCMPSFACASQTLGRALETKVEVPACYRPAICQALLTCPL